jgi:hypothetical protein
MTTFIKRLGIFLVIFFLLNYIFVYFYERPVRQAILNKTHNKYLQWSEIKSTNKYDIIFLGSSRGYCAYNPLVFDSIIKMNTFNMSTGSQDIIQTYYILKEILQFQKPKIVVYDICLQQFEKKSDYYQIISNGKFMSKTGKIDMILNGFGFEGISNYILPLMKHKLYIKNDILNFLHQKKIDDNLNHEKTKLIKGYLLDSTIIDSNKIKECPALYNFENMPVSDKKLHYYFKAFFELCKLNDIQLVCVTAPYPPTRLNSTTSDTVSNYFADVCAKQSVPYYDFNYVKNNKYIYKDSDFVDCLHMNFLGANKVSRQLAELLFLKQFEIKTY